MSRPVKHYRRWRIRWTDHDGKRCSEVYTKHRDAELALQRHEVEAEEIRRGLRPRPLGTHTFNELADYWIEHRASRKRSKKDDESIIRRHLRPSFGAMPLVQVTVERIDEWRQGLECSTKTEHNFCTLLISMFRLAVDELHWLRERPLIKKPKLTDDGASYRYFATDEEIVRFLRAARDHDERAYVLYTAAIYTGMRAGELAGLHWEDVDLVRRLITVRRSFENPTKSGRVRHVPILDALLPVLREWRLRNDLPIVFPNNAAKIFQPSARPFQETLHLVLEKAGFARIQLGGRSVPFLTFHGMRHTWASHWMMKGGSIFKLQRIGGWKSFAMVQRYAHLAPEAFVEDYGRLGSALDTQDATVIAFPMPKS